MTSPGANYTTLEEASQRKPIEVFHFWTYDEATHWRYTSYDKPIAYGAATYNPAFITRAEVDKNIDLSISRCNIDVSNIDSLVADDLTTPQTQRIWAEVYKLHSEDLTLAKVMFLGFIKRTIFDGGNCRIECTGFEEFLHRIVPKDRYQPTCNKTVFDDKCTLNKATYATIATVTAVSADGMTVTCTQVSAQAVDYYKLGYIKAADAERRLVAGSSGANLSMRFPVSSIASGDAVTVYPGCDRLITTCNAKYSNQENFLGHPYMPIDNPCLWDG